MTATVVRGVYRFAEARGVPASWEFWPGYDVIEAFCVAGLAGRASSNTRQHHTRTASTHRQRSHDRLTARPPQRLLSLFDAQHPEGHDECMDLGRITVDHQIMGGVPCVRGTRIPVATIVGLVANGLTTDEITAEYPQLTPTDVQACLGYAARAVDERELPVRLTA